MLPIEVIGEAGTTATVYVHVPAECVKDAASLWMQITAWNMPLKRVSA